MNPHALLSLVLAPEIIADGFYVESQFICNAFELPLGSLSLMRRNSLNVIIISVEF